MNAPVRVWGRAPAENCFIVISPLLTAGGRKFFTFRPENVGIVPSVQKVGSIGTPRTPVNYAYAHGHSFGTRSLC